MAKIFIFSNVIEVRATSYKLQVKEVSKNVIKYLQNDRKDWYTPAHLRKKLAPFLRKKLKLKSQDPKSTICFQSNLPKTMFCRSCIFSFFGTFIKNAPSISTLPVILSNFNKMMFTRFSWGLDFFFKDKYHRKIHWKNYDDCFINGWDI